MVIKQGKDARDEIQKPRNNEKKIGMNLELPKPKNTKPNPNEIKGDICIANDAQSAAVQAGVESLNAGF